MENFLSTKFIMSIVCLIMVFIGFIIGKIDTNTFMPFVLGILGIFTGGNVASKFIKPDSAN